MPAVSRSSLANLSSFIATDFMVKNELLKQTGDSSTHTTLCISDAYSNVIGRSKEQRNQDLKINGKISEFVPSSDYKKSVSC